MPKENLRKKAVDSVVWTSAQHYSNILIGFISGIILARLLTPNDYGCIGLLTIFMTVSETFIDGGFGSALIQKKKPTQVDYSTIFYWNMFMSVVMYAILFFGAPVVAKYYHIPLLSDVLRVQGLILFVYALNIIQRNQLRKNLNFKFLAKVSVATHLAALLITVYLAYSGFGVWALVVQHFIIAAIPCLVFWFYVRWRPQRVFSWKSFRELFGFGSYMFFTHLVNRFCTELPALFIGKLYSPAALGYYSKARRTERLASHSISSVLTQVTYPLYVKVQDDKVALGNMVGRLTKTVAFLTFPLMFVLILVAQPLFVLLYSDRWLASVPYFQALCLVGLAGCMQAINTQTIAAIGKSRAMFLWTLVKRSVGVFFMLVGLFTYGMMGFMVGVVIYNWFCYAVNIGLVSKHIGYKWHKQLMDLLPVTMASVVALAFSYVVSSLFNFSLYVDGLTKVVLFMVVYIGWIVLFKPESYCYTRDILSDKFPFLKRFFRKSVESK